jgi:competence protein ComEA
MTDKLNINSAGADALDAHDELRGHGPEIVRYREERGGFTKVEQLDEVPGLTGKVGPETLALLSVDDG